MGAVLLSPGYFGPIDLFATMIQSKDWIWEKQDNYQKQTYRTRQYIYGANGKLLLNIPVQHSMPPGKKQKYKEVKIDFESGWHKIHWKSLQAAYSNSPFFEFYQDELAQVFEAPSEYLMDFNLQCIQVLLECLQIENRSVFTEEYQQDLSNHQNNIADGRYLIQAKRKSIMEKKQYEQVFMEKHGFLENLSILDLLFNKGPESLNYLEEVVLSL